MVLNKVTVTLSAILLHLAIGSVYAWSVLTKPIMENNSWTFEEVATVFGLTIAVLGFSAAFLGPKVRQWGPKKSCLLSTLFFVLGLLLSSVAISLGSLVLLYFSYGVLVGIGTGIAYLTPIPILMTWYPDNRGLATGLVVSGFGLSGLLAGYGYYFLIYTVGLSDTFTIVALVSLLFMLPSVFLLRDNSSKVPVNFDNTEHHREVYLKSISFRLLWVVFFINIFVGVAALSALAPLLVDMFHVSAFDAANFVAIAALVNGISRCAWSSLSDFIGRPLTFVMMVFLEAAALSILVLGEAYYAYYTCLLILISCYGGMFATMPGYLADLWGTVNLSECLGLMLTAWGVAGFLGPKVLAYCYYWTSDYDIFFIVGTALMVLNFGLTIYLSERNLLKNLKH